MCGYLENSQIAARGAYIRDHTRPSKARRQQAYNKLLQDELKSTSRYTSPRLLQHSNRTANSSMDITQLDVQYEDVQGRKAPSSPLGLAPELTVTDSSPMTSEARDLGRDSPDMVSQSSWNAT